MSEPIKTEEKRNPDGTFAPGTAPGPGRPKGKSLKEYWKQRFANMTDEEKEKFSEKVAPEILWKMAEGQPATKIGNEEDEDGLPTPLLVKFINGNSGKAEDNGNTSGVPTTV